MQSPAITEIGAAGISDNCAAGARLNSIEPVAGTGISGGRAAVAGCDPVLAIVIQVTGGDRAGGADRNAGVGIKARNAVQDHGPAEGLDTVRAIASGNALGNFHIVVDHNADLAVGPGNALANMTAIVERDAMTPVVEHAQVFDDAPAAVGAIDAVLPPVHDAAVRMCGLPAGFI